MKNKPILVEVFADNGEHSHWTLVDSDSGSKLWSENPEECKAMGHLVVGRADIEKIYNQHTISLDSGDFGSGVQFFMNEDGFKDAIKDLSLTIESLDRIGFATWIVKNYFSAYYRDGRPFKDGKTHDISHLETLYILDKQNKK